MSNLRIMYILFLTLCLFSTTYADTNGIWHLAKDIRGGIFGDDEQDVTTNFQFINNVYFNKTLFTKTIQALNDEGISFRTNDGTRRFFILDNGNIRINNLINCEGKINADENGTLKCEADLVNDTDHIIGNEYPLAGTGIIVDGRTVNINTSLIATKNYVDNKVNSSSDVESGIHRGYCVMGGGWNPCGSSIEPAYCASSSLGKTCACREGYNKIITGLDTGTYCSRDGCYTNNFRYYTCIKN